MENLSLSMNVNLNKSVLMTISKGGTATLTVKKHQLYVPAETVQVTLESGEEVDVVLGGYYRAVDVKFRFIRDKRKGGSRRR